MADFVLFQRSADPHSNFFLRAGRAYPNALREGFKLCGFEGRERRRREYIVRARGHRGVLFKTRRYSSKSVYLRHREKLQGARAVQCSAIDKQQAPIVDVRVSAEMWIVNNRSSSETLSTATDIAYATFRGGARYIVYRSRTIFRSDGGLDSYAEQNSLWFKVLEPQYFHPESSS